MICFAVINLHSPFACLTQAYSQVNSASSYIIYNQETSFANQATSFDKLCFINKDGKRYLRLKNVCYEVCHNKSSNLVVGGSYFIRGVYNLTQSGTFTKIIGGSEMALGTYIAAYPNLKPKYQLPEELVIVTAAGLLVSDVGNVWYHLKAENSQLANQNSQLVTQNMDLLKDNITCETKRGDLAKDYGTLDEDYLKSLADCQDKIQETKQNCEKRAAQNVQQVETTYERRVKQRTHQMEQREKPGCLEAVQANQQKAQADCQELFHQANQKGQAACELE